MKKKDESLTTNSISLDCMTLRRINTYKTLFRNQALLDGGEVFPGQFHISMLRSIGDLDDCTP